ncbi:hypothetical protein LVY72_14820 [Arthrobacter sp. I2-34]|uniref:Uncharacterized protein n=1 Tax=Arthrobacter hankyongi TaxID=2904801 RepID=A0ABS9L917_9MICC|nr:hypothetical protein [Arthrobacter hankyongi]MCG2623169.1 hypothetical protein [Arthrobacter hankyongi]
MDVARGCATVGHFGPLGVVIPVWEATAAAVADGIPFITREAEKGWQDAKVTAANLLAVAGDYLTAHPDGG